MPYVREDHRPRKDAGPAIFSVPPATPLQCPSPLGFRAGGELGPGRDRAFSPELLVLPGGVPLK